MEKMTELTQEQRLSLAIGALAECIRELIGAMGEFNKGQQQLYASVAEIKKALVKEEKE